MEKKKKFEKHLSLILKEMCKRVGVKLKDIDFNDQQWFMKHEWTEKEEQDFKKWLVDYLYGSKEARDSIMAYPRKVKKSCEDVASWFILDYGWKIK